MGKYTKICSLERCLPLFKGLVYPSSACLCKSMCGVVWCVLCGVWCSTDCVIQREIFATEIIVPTLDESCQGYTLSIHILVIVCKAGIPSLSWSLYVKLALLYREVILTRICNQFSWSMNTASHVANTVI